jgi:hypothetical protein
LQEIPQQRELNGKLGSFMNMTTKFALANSEIISNKCASIISFFWLTGNSVSNFKEFLFNGSNPATINYF